MNLASEYMMRVGRSEHLLSFPFSLFLTERGSGRRLAVTVREGTARHWPLWDASIPLPRWTDYPVYNLFASEYVVVPGYDLLEFKESPYTYRGRQLSVMPTSSFQEFEYVSCLTNFYSPHVHGQSRLNWLWFAFVSAHYPDLKFLRSLYDIPQVGDAERSLLRDRSPKLWAAWQLWRKNMLDFPSKVAPEIVFWRRYNRVRHPLPMTSEKHVAAVNTA